MRGEFRGETGEMIPEGRNQCFEGCAGGDQSMSTNLRHSSPFFSSMASRYRE